MAATTTATRRGRTKLERLTPFTLEHFRLWAREHELDNGDPWKLEPFEERFAADVFSGVPICWLVVPEGNGKTTFASGLALYFIEFFDGAYVPVAASARDQAEWIYRQASGFVYRSERRGTFKCLEGYRRIRCDGMHSRIQVFAADDRSGDGIIPGGIAVLDELHRHRDLALYRTWQGKLRKRNAQLIVISTAGEVGGEFELEREQLRKSASTLERDGCFVRALSSLDGKPLSVLHDYALPDDASIDDLELVAAANPASSVTVETLREKRAVVRNDQHWSRFTCNRPARSSQAAISEAEWFAAVSDERIPEGERVWVGLDLGWKRDPTAVVPLWVRDAHFRLLGPAAILVPPGSGVHLDPRLVEEALLAVHERNPIEAVVMDPTAGEQLAVWISETIGCEVVERDQRNPYRVLDFARFTEALREGWLKHSGDPGLTRHVLNATAGMLPGGDLYFTRPAEGRLGRASLQETRQIDALVAAAMAHCVAVSDLDAGTQPLVAFV